MATVIETKIGGMKVKLVAVMQGEDIDEIETRLGVASLGNMDGKTELFIGRRGDVANWSEVQDEYSHWSDPIEAAGVEVAKVTEIVELHSKAYAQSGSL